MRKKFTSLILILILALSTTHTAYATSVSDLQKQRQEKENEKKGTQGQLDSLNDQINDLSGEKEDVEAQISGLTSSEFCEQLLREKEVAIIPGSAFGASGEGYARISYAYSVDHLQTAMKRIREFLHEHGWEK